jgi:hypothetical protein
MANMPRGITVQALVDRQIAFEYLDPRGTVHLEASGPVIRHRFIESKDNAFFGIKLGVDEHYSFSLPAHALRFDFFADGMYMGGRICKSSDLEHGQWTRSINGKIFTPASGSHEVQELRFARIHTGKDISFSS